MRKMLDTIIQFPMRLHAQNGKRWKSEIRFVDMFQQSYSNCINHFGISEAKLWNFRGDEDDDKAESIRSARPIGRSISCCSYLKSQTERKDNIGEDSISG